MVTFEHIRDADAGVFFPCKKLRGLEDALVLFAAGFLGKQDAFWIAEAGLQATCVDTDADRLGMMEQVYPERWEFVCADVFEYTSMTGRVWDAVTVDCPTGAFDMCAAALPLWCELARSLVVLGCGTGTAIEPPAGWELTEKRLRSSRHGTYWAVLEC